MKTIVDALRATAELYGKSLSPMAGDFFAEDLRGYPEQEILDALSRCRKELRAFPTVADILNRIPSGWTGVEEAWSLVPKNESDSSVWCDEIGRAYDSARDALNSGDMIAARMVFKEVYEREVSEARAKRRKPNWWPSLGTDASGRAPAILKAIEQKRLTGDSAIQLLESLTPTPATAKALQLIHQTAITKQLIQDMPR